MTYIQNALQSESSSSSSVNTNGIPAGTHTSHQAASIGGALPSFPNMSPEMTQTAARMVEQNPALLKQAAAQLSMMSDEHLEMMARMQGVSIDTLRMAKQNAAQMSAINDDHLRTVVSSGLSHMKISTSNAPQSQSQTPSNITTNSSSDVSSTNTNSASPKTQPLSEVSQSPLGLGTSQKEALRAMLNTGKAGTGMNTAASLQKVCAFVLLVHVYHSNYFGLQPTVSSILTLCSRGCLARSFF